MEKTQRLLKKLETDNEAGLTNAQLMLTNHDLKPGNSSFCFPHLSSVLYFLSFPSLNELGELVYFS
jgi:hypothetical protein